MINLIHNNGFKWYHDNYLWVKGYAYAGNVFKSGSILLKYLNEFLKTHKPDDLKNVNGIFSLIYQHKSVLYIYSDKSRFFPVFYRLTDQGYFISDDPEQLTNDKVQPDKSAYIEFKAAGIVTGNRTLYRNIFQVQAGELLQLKENGIESKILFSYKTTRKEIQTYDDSELEMYRYLNNAFEKSGNSLTGKTPVLPLSGGFDSRLIACKLKELGFDNTICFTYGRQNKEVKVSETVAKKLGFKWHFIDYEKEFNNRNLLEETQFLNYFPLASRAVSMFYLQEYLAVEKLKKNGMIPENSVFLPGHSGDLLGGSQFVKVFSSKIKPDNVAAGILKTKFFLYPLKKQEKIEIKESVKTQITEFDDYLGYSILEDWDIKEKIAKFIINSSQVFVFFGYEVRFPFWDNELVEFFRTLSPLYKSGMKLYNNCLRSRYFNRYQLNFEKELHPSNRQLKLQSLKNLIKSFLPGGYKKKLIFRSDWPYYSKMTETMFKELNNDLKRVLPYENYNSIIINWYLKEMFPEYLQDF
ncbi:MAG: asparagine synthase [Bacteroidales bacterium]|nr:asparagine synthase [Bacteroidales bacterium]